ncbi:MAG: Trypsin-like peptidase domain/TPR repeat, partial [Phormidium sp. OSCR]
MMKPNLVLVSLSALMTGCAALGESELTPSEIAEQVNPSLVKITYLDRQGHGSGFFVEGKEGVCTVLTAAHVVASSQVSNLTTSDGQMRRAQRTIRFPSFDLALVTFEMDGGGPCPYPELSLADSDQVSIGERLQVSGYPSRVGQTQIVAQFAPAEVTSLNSLAEGYGIAYTATTAGGMSGGPVVNRYGKVVGVHGMTDAEIVNLAQLQQSSSSPEQQRELEAASTRANVARLNTFKWAIPVNVYRDHVDEAWEAGQAEWDEKTAEDWVKDGNGLLAQERYEEAIVLYDRALEMQPDYADAWI